MDSMECQEEMKVAKDYWRCVHAEQELVAGNSLLRKNDVYKYTWVRMVERRVVNRALMDYVLLPKRIRGRLLDVKVSRGEGGGMTDHFLVEAQIKSDWMEKCRAGGGCEKCLAGK